MKLHSHFLIVIALFILPSELFPQWQQLNGPRCDEVLCFTSKDTVLMAGTWDGLFLSYDKGQNWIYSNNGMEIIPGYGQRVHSVCIKDGLMFAGTAWDHLYRSADNGITWTPSDNGISAADPYYNDLFVLGDTIFAGMHDSIYYSVNNGVSWVAAGVPGYDYHIQFAKKSDRLFVATNYGGILKSSDAGLNWSQLMSFPHTYYCHIASNSDYIFASGDSSHLYRSADNGSTWQYLFSAPACDFIYSLECNDSLLIIGTLYHGIFYSTDNGISWEQSGSDIPRSPINAIYFDDNDLFAGTYGGAFLSQDFANSWSYRYNGFHYGDVYKIVITDSALLTNGIGLFRSPDMGNTWEFYTGGLDSLAYTGYVQDFTILNDKIFIATYEQGIFRSDDNGFTWNEINNGFICRNFTNIASSGQNLIISGDSCGTFISSDFGNSWQLVTDIPLTSYGYCYYLGGSDSVLYVNVDHTTYKSYDHGQNWATNSFQLINSSAVCDSVIFRWLNNAFSVSWDYGASWSSMSASGVPEPVPGYLDVQNLETNGNDFFFGSQHCGVYKYDGNQWFSVNTGLPANLTNNGVHDLLIRDSLIYISMAYNGILKRNINDINIQHYSGKIYEDENFNGIMDPGEQGIPDIMVTAAASHNYSTSDSTGNYSIYTDNIQDSIIVNYYSLYGTVSPSYYYVTQSDTGLDFGINYIPNVHDLRVCLTDIFGASPGFSNNIVLTYENAGTVNMDGDIKMVYDSNLTFISATPSPNNMIGDTLFWSFYGLAPLQQQNISLYFNLPSGFQLGSALSSEAFIYPLTGDTMPYDNYYWLRQLVTGSYDPNDKSVFPDDGLTPDDLAAGKKLYYTIRFQNTGTDTAHFVKITDTLSLNLNILSLQVLSASHPYTYSVHGDGIVEFQFDNIMLPDSNVNEPESHGFVKYSIEALGSLEIGDTVKNEAYIYFDYNTPVLTNTVISVIHETSSFIENYTNVPGNYVLFPNPTTANFRMIGKGIIEAEIYNEWGEKILISKGNEVINMENYPGGVYLVKISTANSTYIRKLVKL